MILNLENCKFTRKYGGISVWIQGLINITIENCQFSGTNNEAKFGEIGVLTYEINNFFLKNSKFSHYIGNALKSVSITRNSISQFNLRENKFYGNKAFYGPSILMKGFFDLALNNNKFSNNSAILDTSDINTPINQE